MRIVFITGRFVLTTFRFEAEGTTVRGRSYGTEDARVLCVGLLGRVGLVVLGVVFFVFGSFGRLSVVHLMVGGWMAFVRRMVAWMSAMRSLVRRPVGRKESRVMMVVVSLRRDIVHIRFASGTFGRKRFESGS
jgi:hypothetical protein